MNLGNIHIDVISDGIFRLDGGGMFGVVPKMMWNQWNPADDQNRINLGLNCLLLRAPGFCALVDTGMGNKWDPKMKAVYDLRQDPDLLTRLAQLGVQRTDITHVLLTHLHLDHAGWNTMKNPAGDLEITFPNARHIVQAGEWDAATKPDVRSKPSYIDTNFLPIREAGLFDFVTGEQEILPGIWTLPTPGHTLHHQSFRIHQDGQTLIYLGDIMPTTAHLRPNYVMGFDLYPLEVMRHRDALLKKMVAEHWICVFEHDPRIPVATIELREGKQVVQEWH